jgi:hypothetical protein
VHLASTGEWKKYKDYFSLKTSGTQQIWAKWGVSDGLNLTGIGNGPLLASLSTVMDLGFHRCREFLEHRTANF